MLTLYPHQREGVDFLTANHRVILADDMGLGKSAEIIHTCEEILYPENRTSGALVVVPASLRLLWGEELLKWSPAARVVIVGAENEDFDIRQEQIKQSSDYTVVSYEMIITITHKAEFEKAKAEEDTKARAKARKKAIDQRHLPTLLKRKYSRFIFDEAHRLRGRSTKAYEAAKMLVKSNPDRQLVIMATGTPVITRPEELWSYLSILYPEQYGSFWKWAEEWCTQQRNYFSGYNEVTGIRDPQKLQETLKNVILRRTKAQVLNLPPRTFVNIPVKLTMPETRMYTELKKRRHTTYKGVEIEAPNGAVLALRLQQICTSPDTFLTNGTDPGEFRGSKASALLELVEDTQEQFLIFTRFRTGCERISKFLMRKKIRVGTIHGEIFRNERRQSIDLFRQGTYRGLVCTYGAASEGETWNEASMVICVDRLYSPAFNNQAVDRAYRIGQDKPVTVYSLVSKDTIEEAIIKKLGKREAMFDSLIPLTAVLKAVSEELGEEVSDIGNDT